MTRVELLAAVAVGAPALAGLVALAAPRERVAAAAAIIASVPTALAGGLLALLALADPASRDAGDWIVLDAAGGVLLGVVAAVGLAAVLFSPAYGPGAHAEPGTRPAPWRTYYASLLAFWALLLAVPLCANLAGAWLLIEASTAVTALLVGLSGRRRALEAGWKYLVLGTLGLGVALLGIVLLQTAQGTSDDLAALSFGRIAATAGALDGTLATIALVLIVGGLAAKIGWAPVHNWLPDAHSEAPAPVSALLSSALLPTVLLVTWRVADALAPATGEAGPRLFIGFGLASLAIAIPFLWRPLAWKRLLAYSSLEHMGVIALGVGFGGRIAVAGVAIHVAGHALAKTTGFLVALPLLAARPEAAEAPPRGLARQAPRLGGVAIGTLVALGGLPPSPLFASELLILVGGIEAGHPVVVGVAALLLALGFIGLLQATLDLVAHEEGTLGALPRSERAVAALAAVALVGLLALAVAALALPGAELARALAGGMP